MLSVKILPTLNNSIEFFTLNLDESAVSQKDDKIKMENKTVNNIHTCHISHCEIKSHIIWPIWKAIPIKKIRSHRLFKPFYNRFYEEINRNRTFL